ncbi:histidine kinase [Demequina sp. B12]|uniref:sensor histidine kinase n=1 Tax=Demequina sp. B12 TaxID=2992757 RepID=UPI00237BCBB3|nr:histidine kinase [Demequina sp. B12]MDE0572409.1 histidine kinase [Demequina sp. B12]
MDFKAPRWTDALVAASLLALTALWAASLTSLQSVQYRPMDAWGWVLVSSVIAPLIWRQHYPRAVLWFTFGAWMLLAGMGYEATPAMLALFVAIYGVASYTPRAVAIRHAAVMLGLMLTWTALGMATLDSVHPTALLAEPIGVLIPFMLGVTDRRRRERLGELEVAHARREQAAFEAATDAVRAERARIARELHDVVAHEITVMTLQAEGARRRVRDEPEVAEALATISASGRRGLEEMQRMIRVLRASEQEATERADKDKVIAGAHGAMRAPLRDELAPMPSLAALPSLVKQVREAGLPVTLEVSGSAHVPAGVELSAYRIIQEALTNTLKHGGTTAHAQVTVNRTVDAVRISVEDNGVGTSADRVRVVGGHGLTGMAERVQAVGGSLSHGPRTGGGFQVHAVLPSGDDQINEAAAAAEQELP